MWRRWNELSGPERYEFWARAGLYLPFAVALLFDLTLARAQQVRVPGLVVFLLLSAGQAGACAVLLHASVSRYLARGPAPRRWLVAAAIALTAAGVLAGAAAFPAFTRSPVGAFPVSMLVAMLLGGTLTVALAPLLRTRALLAVVLVGAAAASGMSASIGGAGVGAHGQALAGSFLIYAFFIGAFAVLIGRVSPGQLRIMWELDRSRTEHARLSVAEERLRFARDLHDVLGRNLSLIAVQSELAAELARRGDQDAAGQMLQVRQVAHESLREMRAVVSGYRTADLGTELAGAQEVLRSAGVSCRVIGDAAGLPPDVQAALGWVVREGTTNIIRHSDATACTIELHILDSPGAPRAVTLSMDNDRVHTLDAGSGGSGLAGLGERLAGLGGSITTGHPPNGRFRLEASLPACGRSGAARPGPARHRCHRRDARAVIRVLLADDENLIRTALASLLAIQEDLEVVAQAASGDEALAMARRHRPDVAVLDLQMPGLDGIAVAEKLVTELPACGSLILTSYGRPGHLKRALAAGVRGFLPKTVSAQVLADVVRTVHRGGRYVDPELAADAISAGDSPLTPREADVLELAAGGAPVDEIAKRAALTPGTVRNYLSSAAAKLGTANRHEAVQLARSRGWI